MTPRQTKLQDLLAPTWRERVLVTEALELELSTYPEPPSPWSQEIQEEIRLLQPSPQAFLSALVAFWAELDAKRYLKRMKELPQKPATSLTWTSPQASLFPMTPATPPVLGWSTRGQWAWTFIERLGPFVSMIELQLLACLNHPEPMVRNAVETAFGMADSMTDAGFRHFLATEDRYGRNGMIRQRAQAIAKHVHGDRLALVLQGLEARISEARAVARLSIIGSLTGPHAQEARGHLLQRINAPWSPESLGALIRALTQVSENLGFDPQTVAAVAPLTRHEHIDVRSGATRFLASHSPVEHLETLMTLTTDPHPWVLLALCFGLTRHTHIPSDLLKAAVAKSLGNYEGHDGEPHDSAIQLLIKQGTNATVALPEILDWWSRVSAEENWEFEEIKDALTLADMLGAFAAPMKPGFERVLEHRLADLADEEDQTPEEEDWLAGRLRAMVAALRR
jgi:hypothetical protein